MAKELSSSTLSFLITFSDSFTGAVGISMENYVLKIMYTCPVTPMYVGVQRAAFRVSFVPAQKFCMLGENPAVS